MATNAKNLAELLNTDTTVAVGDIADGSVTTAKLAASAVTTAKVADDAVTGAKLYAENLGRRNLIINGAMEVAQRGTTKTLTANDNSNYHTVDRWGQFVDIDQGSGSLSVTISQSTDVPSTESFSYSLKAATTSSSFVPSGSDNIALFTHKIETYNANPLGWGTSGAKAATLSYWIKSDTAGTGTLQIRLTDSSIVSGSSDGNYYTNFTINQANTWEYKTHLIPANSTDGWRRTVSNIALHIHWYFGSEQSAAGTQDAWYRENNHGRPHSSQTLDFMTNSGEAYLTGVQLEVGDTATPFEHRSYGEELSLCQRYYNRLGLFYARVRLENVSSQNPDFVTTITFPTMRDAPTINTYTDANYSSSGATTTGGSALTFGNISNQSATAGMNSSSSGAQNISNSCYLELDKEL